MIYTLPVCGSFIQTESLSLPILLRYMYTYICGYFFLILDLLFSNRWHFGQFTSAIIKFILISYLCLNDKGCTRSRLTSFVSAPVLYTGTSVIFCWFYSGLTSTWMVDVGGYLVCSGYWEAFLHCLRLL